MTFETITPTLVYIEELHRHVFDTYYIQGYEIKPEDEIVIESYNDLCKKYPRWRSQLKEKFPGYVKYQRYSSDEF